jgi:hypothetical protein
MIERSRQRRERLWRAAYAAKPEGEFVIQHENGRYFERYGPFGISFVSAIEDASVYVTRVEADYVMTGHFAFKQCVVRSVGR